MFKIILASLIPVFLLIYGILDHYKFIDHMTGRDLTQEGLNRLKSTKGYPTNFIDKEKENDVEIFLQLEKIIIKNTKEDKIRILLKQGYKPTIIATVGGAIELQGVPKDWPQHERLIYLPNQPIFFIYKDNSLSKGMKSCTLEELYQWIEEEKRRLEFWLIVVTIGMLSIISSILSSKI